MRRSTAAVASVVAVGAVLASPGAGTAATTVYQAESGVIAQGVVESNHSGFTGSGFVNTDNVTGSSVQWSVSVAAAGSTQLVLRYANGTTTARPMTVAVDGTVVSTPSFGGTGAWTTWTTTTVTTATS
jgi:hypothetical protein